MTFDRHMILSTAGALLVCIVGSYAAAHEYEIGKIKVEHPWLRAPLDGETKAQFFMFVYNNGDQPDRLIGVKSAQLGSSELRAAPQFAVPAESIYLPPHSKVTLAPGGSFVELRDIEKINPVGWGFELTLVFEKAGEVAVDAAIDAPDAAHAHDAEALERWQKTHGEQKKHGEDAPSGEGETKGEHHDHMNHGGPPQDRENDAAPTPEAE
jgi:hypothetical protein